MPSRRAQRRREREAARANVERVVRLINAAPLDDLPRIRRLIDAQIAGINVHQAAALHEIVNQRAAEIALEATG